MSAAGACGYFSKMAAIIVGSPFSASPMAAAWPFALDRVLRLRLGDRLPLHVDRIVDASARERHDVIDDVARTAMRIARLSLEGAFRRLMARRPLVGGPRRRRFGWP